ncbi:MAG: SDR family oxidoreductase [Bacteroidales bacterium]|jgi:NAD(P)-dependent dehydrogenase (short-subunit alcohol dehydrogenase family)|nr:SDR family oxidoreductase [Bacteroidales bacterium]
MNIVINGGTRGIGRDLAKILAADSDNRILVTGRSEDLLRSLSAEHQNICWIVADLADYENAAGEIAGAARHHLKSIDILVNMAGFLVNKPFAEILPDEAETIMKVNFLAPAGLIREFLPLMNRGSHIVNISSMGGYQGSQKYRGLSFYSASKAALACLSECLAPELSEAGISVNCLALGAAQTDMLAAAFPGYTAPVTSETMAKFIAGFATTGHKVFNGKILPVAVSNP